MINKNVKFKDTTCTQDSRTQKNRVLSMEANIRVLGASLAWKESVNSPCRRVSIYIILYQEMLQNNLECVFLYTLLELFEKRRKKKRQYKNTK